jgi:hypothetical protein
VACAALSSKALPAAATAAEGVVAKNGMHIRAAAAAASAVKASTDGPYFSTVRPTVAGVIIMISVVVMAHEKCSTGWTGESSRKGAHFISSLQLHAVDWTP